MIYEFPEPGESIQQGDIFRYIPKILFDLGNMPTIDEEKNITSEDWLDLSAANPLSTSLVTMKPVLAIVITQDCDVVRIDDIALCEIAEFSIVEKQAEKAVKPKAIMSVITKHSRLNLKWFYLPEDEKMGFTKKMAADFHSVLPTSRSYLEKNIAQLRIGRLNPMARQHFRERLSEYYRRYPYDEWYSLNKSELEEYVKDHPDTTPLPWQNGG